MNILQKALEYSGFKTRSYSGRGMYGRECLGVVIDTSGLGKLISELIYFVCEQPLTQVEGLAAVHELAEMVAGYREDSMGMSTIVYFPNVDYEEEEVA